MWRCAWLRGVGSVGMACLRSPDGMAMVREGLVDYALGPLLWGTLLVLGCALGCCWYRRRRGPPLSPSTRQPLVSGWEKD